MAQKPFGVNLKRTGVDPRGFTPASSAAVASSHGQRKSSTSIHTPLKPANVKDLKAMFDDKKEDSGAGAGTANASSSGNSSPQSGGMSPRSGPTSPRSASPGHASLTSKKSDSGLRVVSNSKVSTTLTTSSTAASRLESKVSVDNKSSKGTSGVKITGGTAVSDKKKSDRPDKKEDWFPDKIDVAAILSSSSSSVSSTGSSVKSNGKPVSGNFVHRSPDTWVKQPMSQPAGMKSACTKTFDWKDERSVKKEDSRIEIPIQHFTPKTVSSAYENKSKFETSTTLAAKPVSKQTTMFKTIDPASSALEGKKKKGPSSSSSLSSKGASSSEQNTGALKLSTKVVSREIPISREIPVQRVASISNKKENNGVSMTKTQSVVETNSSRSTSSVSDKQFLHGVQLRASTADKRNSRPENPQVPDPRRLSTRQLSTERFERLKFDFERGVPTENEDRRSSETTDHLELQLKARELQKSKMEAEEDRLKREESIFAQGMKVSDFVKHINTVHPQSSSVDKSVQVLKPSGPKSSPADSGDQEGENQYIEVPEQDGPGGGHGIYEFVGDGAGEEGKNNPNYLVKGPSRRHGVYRKDKGRSGSEKRKSHTTEDSKANGGGDLNDSAEISSGEDVASESSGTDYEPVEDNLYEDPDALQIAAIKQKKEDKDKEEKSLGVKFKKNVDKATNYLNKITKFNKKKPTKDSTATVTITAPVPAVGTDSEADEEDAASDVSPLSRTSSERSSGRLSRSKDKELSVEIPIMHGDDDDHRVATPPPPLPPRAAKVLKEHTVDNSPPLPPRNPNLTVSLDVVIPVSPRGGLSTGDLRDSMKKFPFGRDSYHSDSGDATDSHLSKSEGYVDSDATSPRSGDKIDRKDKTAGHASTKTSSSSYLYPDDISDWPDLHGADSEDDDLYIELADDQIYGRHDHIYTTKFESEPLYQWYAKDKLIRGQKAASDVSGSGEDTESSSADDSSVDEKIYEDVERLLKRGSTIRGKVQEDAFERNAPARRSVIMDVFSKSGTLHRALWCEMPEVRNSGILNTMDPQERKVQESMFEIMTSEASYLKSLNVLINVFLMAPEFSMDMSNRCILSQRERQFLFSNIGCIRDISAKFLADLEARWQESCIMTDVCDIMSKHAEKNFEPYIRYCSNQAFQERALDTLTKRPDFCEAVKRLEQHKDCQYLPMSSFLLLPMQRITRLPLLVDAIRHRIDPGTPRHTSATRSLDFLNRVVKACNEGAKKMLQTEQMCLLAAGLEYTKIKELALVSSSRFLVKQGELNKIATEGTSRIPFGRKSKEHVYLYLFNDILLVTKKKGNVYQVKDYCQRNALHVEMIDHPEKSKFLPQGAAGFKNLFLLALLSNHEKKQVEIVLSAKSESERTRWLDAILPQQSNPEFERIYEDWDCPQVQCVEKYNAQEPDELTLEESDVINVFKKMGDGWYEGERIRDGERGWFPADHTEEINNSHVRARNLRLRYRLIIASQEYSNVKFVN